MSKYSLKNILLGFGIGVVFVSMINLNAGQRKLTVEEIKNEAGKYNLIVLEQKDIINKQNQEQNTTVTPPVNKPTPGTTTANNGAGNTANAQTNTTQTPAPQQTPAASKPTASKPPAQPVLVTINIPEGKTSEGIAQILADNGLISNKKDFLTRIGALGKENRLHSGKFTFKKGTNIDEIISVLVNSK